MHVFALKPGLPGAKQLISTCFAGVHVGHPTSLLPLKSEGGVPINLVCVHIKLASVHGGVLSRLLSIELVVYYGTMNGTIVICLRESFGSIIHTRTHAHTHTHTPASRATHTHAADAHTHTCDDDPTTLVGACGN